MNTRRIVFVIGMHRSGTSAITSGLQLMGVSLGDSLNPPSPGINDKGFFEDIDVLDLNIRLLQSIGHRWDSVTPIEEPDLSSPPIASLALEAISMLRKKLSSSRIFGIKDPRVTLLLPFWQHVCLSLGIEPSYIVAVRNPLSVASSLAKRDEMPREFSTHLWQKYLLHSLEAATQSLSIFVNYDQFVDQPVQQLARIAERLALDFDPASEAVKQYVGGFLEDDLRHSRYSDDELEQAVPLSIYQTYRLLDDLATDRMTLDRDKFYELLEALRQQWNDANRSRTILNQLEMRVTRLERLLGDQLSAVSVANALVRTRDEQVAASDALVKLRDEQLARCEAVVLERDREIEGLRALLKHELS